MYVVLLVLKACRITPDAGRAMLFGGWSGEKLHREVTIWMPVQPAAWLALPGKAKMFRARS